MGTGKEKRTKVSGARFLLVAVLVLGWIIASAVKTPGFYRAAGMLTSICICFVILQPITQWIYAKISGSRKNRLSVEKDVVYCEYRSFRVSVKLCMIEILVCFWGMNRYNSMFPVENIDNFVMRMTRVVVYILIPYLLFKSRRSEEEKNKERIRRIRMKDLESEKIWLMQNLTEQKLKSWSGKYTAKGQLTSYEAFMLTTEDIRCLFPKEKNLLEKMNRWCYVVEAGTQEELEQQIERIYEEYLQLKKDGLRKIVILRIRGNYNGKRLCMPDKYKNYEFLYYVEVDFWDKLSYEMLVQACGDSLEIYKPKQKKEKKDFRDTGEQYFKHSNLLLQRISEESDYPEDFQGGNTWLVNFYSSACVFQNPTRATMALLDYWELMLRLVSIYYYQQMEAPDVREEELVHGNLMFFARFIIRASKIDKEHHELLTGKSYQIPGVMQTYFENLKEYIYIHFQGESVNFLGLVSMVQVLRNKIIAHGVLNEENAPIVWGIMFWASGILNAYLRLSEFQLSEEKNSYKIGYENLVESGNLIVKYQGCPCIAAIQKGKGKKYLYVNFFDGEMITPEYVEPIEA